MDTVDRALARVRGWVIAAFVVQSVAGTLIAIDVIELLKRTGAVGGALESHEPVVTIAWTVVVLLGLLVLLLWLFDRLLHRQAWARVVLLVVAWISAVSAAISIASSPLSGVVVDLFVSEATRGGLASLMLASLLTNAMALASWGYLIWVLQFREDVKAAFPRCGPSSPTTHAPSR